MFAPSDGWNVMLGWQYLHFFLNLLSLWRNFKGLFQLPLLWPLLRQDSSFGGQTLYGITSIQTKKYISWNRLDFWFPRKRRKGLEFSKEGGDVIFFTVLSVVIFSTVSSVPDKVAMLGKSLWIWLGTVLTFLVIFSFMYIDMCWWKHLLLHSQSLLGTFG